MKVDLVAAREEITLPKALKDALMCLASSKRIPLEVVDLTRSEPARSTKVSLPVIC